MASEATTRDPTEVPGLSPLPPVHMERLSSWQSIPDDNTAEESGNKTMDAAISATADDAEAGNTKLGSSVSGESSIRKVLSSGNPDYHNVGAYRALFTMVKTQIGIGALSLPLAYDKIGLIPGIFCLNLVAIMAAFACYQIGQAKRRHSIIRTFEDLGQYLFGKWGREVFGAVYCLYFAFTTASAIQALSVGFNAISDGGACTVWFKFLALVIVGAFASIRTLGKISWLSIFGVGCILSSLLAVTIATAVQERPPSAPAGPWKSDFKLFTNPSAVDVMSAMGTFCFSYSGIMAYFVIQDEMKNPKHYNKTMFSSLVIIAIVYTIASAVVYCYCGSYVSSPALGSAGGVMKKVCYGLATPGLIVTGIIVCHLTIKYMYFRITGENRKLPERDDTMDSVLMRPEEVQPRPSTRYVGWRQRYRRVIWFCCSMSVLVFAFVIANVIPYFDDLITLIGALLGTFMLCLPMAYYWLYDNWSVRQRNLVWWLTVCWCVSLLVFGAVFLVGGTYAASDAIWFAQHNETAIKPWSCADNSLVKKELHH